MLCPTNFGRFGPFSTLSFEVRHSGMSPSPESRHKDRATAICREGPRADIVPLSSAQSDARCDLLDHPVRALQDIRWNCHADRLSRFEIDDQFVSNGDLYRQIARVAALEDLVNDER